VAVTTPGAAQEPAPLALPLSRPVDRPPAVADVGVEVRTDGGRTTLPRLAVLASMDMELYAGQLETLFPKSVDYYPADSLRKLRIIRAGAWVTRLRALGARVHGLELLDFAKLAVMAEQDSVAVRLIEARLAEIPPGPSHTVERSGALAGAVLVLTDPSQDSLHIGRVMERAESYAARLFALPASGFATRTDSTDVLHRKLQAAQALMVANTRLPAADRITHYSDQTFSIIAQLSPREQREAVMSYPYAVVASALISRKNGRALIDSVEQRLLRLADGGTAGTIQDLFSWFAMLGQPAPPVSAHVWFNTPDSVYAPAPRVHPFNDGIVRVLVLGDQQSNGVLTLDRLQRTLPRRVQVIFVTNIRGSIGQTLAKPEDEVAWLRNYYRVTRHLVVPIALWAGAKTPSSYGWPVPIPSAVPSAYHSQWMLGKCVLIDGKGIVREYLNAVTREDEATIARRVGVLLSESNPTGSAQAPAPKS